jgi:FdhD protein
MRTPGHDAELAAGFLYSEGLVRHAGDIAYIKYERNTVLVTPADGAEIKVAAQ